jgi:hypothetical protein
MTTVTADAFVPNDEGKCLSCGESPTVTVIVKGVIVHDVGLCGPCTWGDATALDPGTWNQS